MLAVEIRAIQGRFVDPDEALHWRQDATVSGLNVMSREEAEWAVHGGEADDPEEAADEAERGES